MSKGQVEMIRLDRIIGGGQTIGQLANGKKALVWGGLPGELVEIRTTKRKSKFVEAVVTNVIQPSKARVEPVDPSSYLSTSPWQIMDYDLELVSKQALIKEAFLLHDLELPGKVTVKTDDRMYNYRNKVEFSWWGDLDNDGQETLDLSFFRRGGRGKIPVDGTALAMPAINKLARSIRDLLRQKPIQARALKSLIIRANQAGDCCWQLYIKQELADLISKAEAKELPALGGEIIYSDPLSPASKISKKLASFGQLSLNDEILGKSFQYATDGFFQINLPIYEKTLTDIKQWVPAGASVVDMYAGVGTIGLTVADNDCTLVEVDDSAYREMTQNISRLKLKAKAILAESEKALSYITTGNLIIVDPPRAGLHQAVIDRLLEVLPSRLIYLSCNPVTQARDIAKLSEKYHIVSHTGYNFFPRTPHIEHLVILELI